ncbi:hypothetical protein [Serratia marcescens]|uniref:RipA family octameric membrane protein n=1 Tax=Serratia marcescens TaxID=615 RepID=UPI0036F5F627
MENNEGTTEYTFPIESKEYFEHLLGKNLSDGEKLTKQDYSKIEEAYNKAHDIRKFEIELYWKRSTYFWAFISVLVAICGVVSAAFLKDGKSPTELRSFLFCTSILGYFISLHFLITCFSGKQWQENWERHIDILESYFSGNLYKLKLVKDKIRYSISLSNEIIVAAINFAWVIIIIYNMLDIPKAIMWKGVVFLIVITAAYLWMSLERSKNTDVDITFNIRTVKSANIIGKSNRYLEQNSTKWANRIITGVVIALLILVVLLLFSTLYYNSDTGKQMELGSLTDWISSLSTVGTLYITYMAYKKAPDWISTKRNESGFEHAMKIIEQFENTYFQLDRVFSLSEAAESNDSMIEKYETSYHQILSDILKLRTLLACCSRYKIEPNQVLSNQTLSMLNLISTLRSPYKVNLTEPKLIKDKVDDFSHLKKKCEDVSNLQIEVLFKFLDKKK